MIDTELCRVVNVTIISRLFSGGHDGLSFLASIASSHIYHRTLSQSVSNHCFICHSSLEVKLTVFWFLSYI
jgi:hypothetical protein